MYKYLLFDLDHTLLDFDCAEDRALDALLAHEGFTDVSAFKDYYIPMNKGMWRDLEKGNITKPELVNTRFSRAFAHFGVEKDGKELAQLYQHFLSQQGQTYEGARELLADLKQAGYQIYAATNGVTAIQQGRLERSGLLPYFDAIFISEQLATAKPSLDFFEKVSERIAGFSKEKTLMIGDSLTADMAGGAAFGIDTAWYNSKQLDNNSPVQPTYTLSDYSELRALLLR